MCEFRVGQKVVFVNGEDIANRWHQENMLVVGTIYTINAIVDFGSEAGIGFDVDGSRRCWQAWRFRPVVERKTSIAIFHEMLKTQRVGVDA